MPERRRLYSPAVHIGYRVIPAAMFTLIALAVVNMAREGAEVWVVLVATAMPLGILLLLAATFWRTRQLHASPTHLEVGRGPDRRDIPFSEVVSLERPGWAFNPMFAAEMITLRDGSFVFFFPASGAESFVNARIQSPT